MIDKLPPVVLVIEPDESKSKSICNSIERYWFNVVRCNKRDHVQRALMVNNINVILLEGEDPNVNVEKFIQEIRMQEEFKELPILVMVSNEKKDQMTKDFAHHELVEFLLSPFDASELMLAIKSLLRKSNPKFQDKILQHRNIKMDLSTYQVYCGKRSVRVGPTEFKILQLLMQSPQKIFSRQSIIDYVWGTDADVDPRTVDVHINRLRSMLHYEELNETVIKTVRSAGYCLVLPGESLISD